MPKLIKLYIFHSAIGFVVSAAFVAMLLWFNVANLWHLVTHTSIGPMAVGLLWLFNGIVFSGVQFGVALMLMSAPSGQGPGKRRRPQPPVAARLAQPVPVAAGPDDR